MLNVEKSYTKLAGGHKSLAPGFRTCDIFLNSHTLNFLALKGGTGIVVVSAIAQYLGCADSVPLSQRMAELERKMAAIEAKENVEAK